MRELRGSVMMKFIQSIICIFTMVLASASHGALITNLTDAELAAKDYSNAQDFLTADKEGINFISVNGWDYAWASPVNDENWESNIFHAPELQKNWQVASSFTDNTNTQTHIDIIRALGVERFTRLVNGVETFIHAVQFWNSSFTSLALTDGEESETTSEDFSKGFIVGEIDFYKDPYGDRYNYFDTFYVRNVNDRPTEPTAPTDIPEPQSVMLLALALLALQIKARKV